LKFRIFGADPSGRRQAMDEGVAFIFSSVGGATNRAVQPYLNQKGVPQLFVASPRDDWADPANHPWTIGWQPSYRIEARVYARYLLAHKVKAKICVLYQNDDFGKDYLDGLQDGLGAKNAKMVINPQFDEAGNISDSMAVIRVGGKFGYIDRSGKMVINPQFDSAGDFHNGRAVAKLGNKFGYIDKSGKVKIPPQFDSAGDFSDGLALVSMGGRPMTKNTLRMVAIAKHRNRPRARSAFRDASIAGTTMETTIIACCEKRMNEVSGLNAHNTLVPANAR